MGLPLAMLLAAIMTMGNLGENYELLACLLYTSDVSKRQVLLVRSIEHLLSPLNIALVGLENLLRIVAQAAQLEE